MADNTTTIKIKARDLRVHPEAQRAFNRACYRKIVGKNGDKFDLDAVGALHVVHYAIAGVLAYWIVDGQHRHRALMDLGLGEWEVTCMVHLDVKDDAAAAKLFLLLQTRSAPQSFDKYTNEMTAGVAETLAVDAIVRKHGFKADRSSRDGTIAAVTSLKRVYGYDGTGMALDSTLGVIVKAWGHTASAVDGKLIEGIGRVFATYNGQIDKASLAKKLAKFPGGPDGHLGAAKGLRQYKRASVPHCVAETTIDLYNKGRREKLDPI